MANTSEANWFGSQVPDESGVKEKRKWSPTEDKILIGAWLNTSKDPAVSTEQKADAFWNRIVDYYNASPLLVGTIPRKLCPCKQRWARINEQVSKFAGCYDGALREQRSGQNDDDIMKAALDIFFINNGYKFALDHCWRELRHDQKWCATHTVVFNVVGDGKTTPLMCVCPERKECSEILSKYLSRKSGESSHR
ncbi:glutathione S-transferase T3-like [Brassica napus]|uniref:glutathione S-transferase T3-like n=1 Tax=Brassica napus TaxID=3708 RepID=UPI0020799041|nr:glutathione S-transferase T3-like [Brassica napus]